MKRQFLISILLFAAFAALGAREVTGTVKCGSDGLEGVVVTDGRNFTSTLGDGSFRLSADDEAVFVYIAVPSGYNPPFDGGTPLFYAELKQGRKEYDFSLSRSASDCSYALFALADPQMKTAAEMKRFRTEIVPDLDSLSKSYLADGTAAVAGIDLGDLAWDRLEYLGKYRNAVKGLPFPCYPVIGNHDHDKDVVDDCLSAAAYRKQFGPEYYAFNLGKDHYVVLDDILYEGGKRYEGRISDAQLDWLEGYLEYVPKGSRVIVAMHIPYLINFKQRKIGGNGRLMDLLEGYRVSFMSGHTHVLATYEAEPGITEFNVSSAGGAWWICDYCVDGTPLGYEVFESSGDSLSWYFKSAGRPRDFQMVLYGRGEVAGDTCCVYAKIWGWDPQWKVEWTEDGQPMGRMDQCLAVDPNYSEQVGAAYSKMHRDVAPFRQPRESFFFFRARPDAGASEIKVTAVDRFGRKYEKSIVLQ